MKPSFDKDEVIFNRLPSGYSLNVDPIRNKISIFSQDMHVIFVESEPNKTYCICSFLTSSHYPIIKETSTGWCFCIRDIYIPPPMQYSLDIGHVHTPNGFIVCEIISASRSLRQGLEPSGVLAPTPHISLSR